MKRLIKVCILLSLITLLTVPVYASHAEDIEINLLNDHSIQPLYTYINVFLSTFDILDNGLASISAHLSAYNVDQVSISAYLQQYRNDGWTTIKSWSNTYDGTTGTFNQKWQVSRGYSYRVVYFGDTYKSKVLVESASVVSHVRSY